MNSATRIRNAFQKGKALIPFITGGDPDIGTTRRLILVMESAGADIIEIGIPFSDPIAEGVVIQKADERALAGGCTTDDIFHMVKDLRKHTAIPLVLMTYINPVFTYGKGRFMERCAESGIDGLIVPDLPYEEKEELEQECLEQGICLISMIAPTSGDRVQRIAQEADGFLYCVSSLGVTGERQEIGKDIAALIQKVKAISDIPCAIGFGISNAQQAKEMSVFSDGVIVGSAIVRLVGEYGTNCDHAVRTLVAALKEAIR